MKQIFKIAVLCSALCGVSQSLGIGHKVWFENKSGENVKIYFYRSIWGPTFERVTWENTGAIDVLSLKPGENDFEVLSNYKDIAAIKVFFKGSDQREEIYFIGGDIITALRKGVTGSKEKPAFLIRKASYSAIGKTLKIVLQ